MEKIVVTGGAGFIGSHLVDRLLKENYMVTVIDNFSTGKLSNLKSLKKNKNLKIINENIINKKKIKIYFKNIKYVFHLAAIAEIVPSIEKPEDYFLTNVSGTLNILELVRENNIKKIIYAASSSCYGIPKYYPTNEKEKTNPQYPYALTKFLGEQLIQHWSKVYGINYISLRLFNVYGPRSRTSGTYGAVFGVFLAQKIAKKPFTVVGDGKQSRDFVYVTDVVDAFYKSAFFKINNEVFNIGSGKTYSINYLVKLIGGKKINIPKRPGEPDMTFADIKKVKNKLKWKPVYNLSKGVKFMLKNINQWNDAPLWDEKKIKRATKSWFKYLG